MKLIRKDRTHNGLVFKEGINCLLESEIFDERPECGSGGLYFCKEEDIEHWLSLYNSDIGYIATVTLCPDSTCVSMESSRKLKADRFILGPFQPIEEFLTVERANKLVRIHGWMLRYVRTELKTAELCLAAVQQNECAFHYVPVELKTATFCLAAVQQNGWTLHIIPTEFQTAELCLAAVQQNGYALHYVHVEHKTAELCLTAVQQSGYALEYVPSEHKTAELCLTAVQQNGLAIQSVPAKLKTVELCLAAVQQNGLASKYVPSELTLSAAGLLFSL